MLMLRGVRQMHCGNYTSHVHTFYTNRTVYKTRGYERIPQIPSACSRCNPFTNQFDYDTQQTPLTSRDVTAPLNCHTPRRQITETACIC
jgi:hypothetical protein